VVISVQEAARRLGVSRQMVNKLIHDGRLPAEWVGAWAIQEGDVERLRAIPRRAGWPKGKPRKKASA